MTRRRSGRFLFRFLLAVLIPGGCGHPEMGTIKVAPPSAGTTNEILSPTGIQRSPQFQRAKTTPTASETIEKPLPKPKRRR